MSNSPGLRGGPIASAIPENFISSPNSGFPRQRTSKVASVAKVFPSNSIDLSFRRKVAKPFDAIFGSLTTNPGAPTARGRSPSCAASRRPGVS